MSAETLRRAAVLMRERADGATDAWGGDPWTAGQIGWDARQGTTYDVHMDLALVAAAGCEELAEHIAGWHPAVALPIAALLEALAQRAEDIADATPTAEFGERVAQYNLTGYAEALDVARAYLGEPA